jgi:hypothetical protein
MGLSGKKRHGQSFCKLWITEDQGSVRKQCSSYSVVRRIAWHSADRFWRNENWNTLRIENITTEKYCIASIKI